MSSRKKNGVSQRPKPKPKSSSPSIFNVDLSAFRIPLFVENRYDTKKWINYGEGEYRNTFPLYLVDLFNQSAIHGAIVKGKTKYITGRGLTLRRGANAVTKKLSQKPNPYDTMDDIMRKITMDYEMHNGFALKVTRAKRGSKIVQIEHLDWTKLRRAKDDENRVLFSNQWEARDSMVGARKPNNNPTDIKSYPIFKDGAADKVSIYYYMDYRPDIGHYPYPEYVHAIPQIETTSEIAKFDLNSIKNGFSGGTILNLLNGYPEDDESAEEIEADVIEKLTGVENANRVLVNFAEDREHAAFVEQINSNDLADQYMNLEDRTKEAIFIGHSVTSPILFGIRTEGQLGGRREILEAYELFKENYALPRQNRLVGALNHILVQAGGTPSLMVEELKPMNIHLPLTDETVERLISDESKKEYIQQTYGVKTIEADPIQDNVTLEEVQLDAMDTGVVAYLESVGERMDDYDVVASHDVDSAEGHLELADFTIANMPAIDKRVLAMVKSNPNESLTAIATALGSGVDETVGSVFRLVESGAISRQGSKMIATTKGVNLYRRLPENIGNLRIMYRYVTRADVPSTKNGSRAFCNHLMSSSKLYTKEDIEGMRNHMKGFNDDVWLYRGGYYTNPSTSMTTPHCRHIWQQVAVRKKNGN